MLLQNTRESAIRREAFHRTLQAWLEESLENRAGDPDSHSGLAWLWVRHGGNHFYLNADSTRAGIRRYMRLVEESGGDPAWSIQDSAVGVRDRVAIGPAKEFIEGFEFYRHLPAR